MANNTNLSNSTKAHSKWEQLGDPAALERDWNCGSGQRVARGKGYPWGENAEAVGINEEKIVEKIRHERQIILTWEILKERLRNGSRLRRP